MKQYIYIITIFLTIATIIGCDDGFEELNKDPFNPTETSVQPVFNAMISTLVRQWAPQTGLEYESMGLSSQITNIYGSSGYIIDGASGELWKNYYTFLSDAKLFEKLIENDGTGLNMTNLSAQKDIVLAYKTVKMVDLFGDIPFYDAGKANEAPEFFYPKYDAQKNIYMDMVALLKNASTSLNESAGDSYSKLGANDVLFNDDILKWKKFANSLRLRHALKAVDAEGSLTAEVADISNNNLPLIEDGEDVTLDPVKLELDLRGPIWAYGGGKVRFGTTMFNVMSDGTDDADIFDPRLRLFSEVNSAGDWNPMPYTAGITETGDPNKEDRWKDQANAGTYTYSPINYWLLTGRYFTPELIFTAAEVHFLKAEAYAKGVGVAVDMIKAKEEYEAGIKSSINYWFNVAKGSRDFGDDYAWQNVPADPTTVEIDAMLANPKVVWDNANALKLIYTQRWVSHIRQIRQGWNVWRQTNMTPQEGTNFVFNRVVYPSSEHTNNADNYSAQVSKMGGDSDAKKIWWMP